MPGSSNARSKLIENQWIMLSMRFLTAWISLWVSSYNYPLSYLSSPLLHSINIYWVSFIARYCSMWRIIRGSKTKFLLSWNWYYVVRKTGDKYSHKRSVIYYHVVISAVERGGGRMMGKDNDGSGCYFVRWSDGKGRLSNKWALKQRPEWWESKPVHIWGVNVPDKMCANTQEMREPGVYQDLLGGQSGWSRESSIVDGGGEEERRSEPRCGPDPRVTASSAASALPDRELKPRICIDQDSPSDSCAQLRLRSAVVGWGLNSGCICRSPGGLLKMLGPGPIPD